MFLRKKADTILIFLTGFGIGFILTILYTEQPIEHKPIKWDSVKDNILIADVKKIRVLCFLTTMPASHSRRLVHIRETWQKHCDKLLFASTLMDVNLGAIGLNVTNDHDHIWGKTKLMLQFIHKHFLDEYDWVFKGDDDTFLIAENLKFLLAAYDPDDPIYFGHKFNTSAHKWGYFSGGSGYVMSRKAVKIFVEKLLTNNTLCPIYTDKRIEDWAIAACFDNANVYAGDSRDLINRDRFLPFKPQYHLFNHRSKWWYWQRKYYNSEEGFKCCSNYSISFHYIPPKHQYTLYYLTYMQRIYGVKRQFPPPPEKRNLTEVVRILNLERFNSSHRGY